jgi:hypothetical protein
LDQTALKFTYIEELMCYSLNIKICTTSGLLTPRSKVLEKLIVAQLHKSIISALFMESGSSVPYSQKPWNGPYPETDESYSTGWSKVKQPIPDTCYICQKTNCKEIKKQSYIKCWKSLLRSAMHAFTLFLLFDATRWRVPVSRKLFTGRDIIDWFGIGESGNVSLNSFWQVS